MGIDDLSEVEPVLVYGGIFRPGVKNHGVLMNSIFGSTLYTRPVCAAPNLFFLMSLKARKRELAKFDEKWKKTAAKAKPYAR